MRAVDAIVDATSFAEEHAPRLTPGSPSTRSRAARSSSGTRSNHPSRARVCGKLPRVESMQDR